MTDDLRGDRPRAVIADELLLRTPADVLRALTECAHRGEPFTISGVTYVPEARLDDLRELTESLCRGADALAEARGFTADGFVPTDLLRDVLAGRMTL